MNVPLPHRILVTRTDRIGDLILSTPVFEALRKKFPESYLAALTFLENRQLVEGNPYLDEVILYDKSGRERGGWGNFRLAMELRKKKFDTVIHLHPTHRMHWVGWLAGIPVRIGYRKKSGWCLTRSLPDRKGEGLKHEAEYNFDLLSFLEVPLPEKLEPYFPLNEKERVSLQGLLKNLRFDLGRPTLVMNPSASCPSKVWQAERFSRLADELYQKHQFQIVVIGGRRDRALARRVKEAARSPILDLSGKLTLGALGWLLKGARLLISNDSGPVHLARAVGTDALSIFGRNLAGLSPRRWGPLGDGGKVLHHEVACPVCLAHNCRINFLCLDVISVEDVLQEVLRRVKG